MTLIEKYDQEHTWYGKVIIMGVYHSVRCSEFPRWTLHDTANDFQVSVGLVSENIRLAIALETNKNLINCKSRQNALDKLK